MVALPEGTVTFVFTDVEGSTRLWEESPDSMMEALHLHDGAIDAAVEAHHGISVKPRGEGDSRFVVFSSAVDAVKSSAEMQQRLTEVDWPTQRPLRVRASIHTGHAELEVGDYYGSAVNHAARLRAIAHGGQTVLSGATFDLVQDHLPGSISVIDMGRHRLKDLTRPEHVYQLNVDGLESIFPPLLSLDAIANNLPEQVTELIGRDGELAEATRLLRDTRLLTILAPGGTGKTRLAIQTAADLISDYADGVFFIGLADISSSGEILQTVAEVVGVALSSDEDPQSQLLNYLAPRRQLLVFDNFEHVSEGALLVAEILKAAPEITVIATSRSKLNLTGESVMWLAGLDTSWETPEEALQTAGVRLFLDGARRSKPDISLSEEDLEPLAEILRLTQGMPLGILLAAAWVEMLSVADIAAEIGRSLDFLETAAADAPDRHRSVRAVFDYTWQLLSNEEQASFAALSVFRGGFTREAAQSVAGASLRDLANLSAKSLVTPNPDTGRYAVHELLRQYAEAELAGQTERNEAVNEAHASYYGDLTHEAFGLFYLSDQPRMLEIIERDLDNIRPAWRRYVATHNSAGVRRMIGGMWLVHEIRGWYQPGLALFSETLDALPEEVEEPLAAVTRAYVLALHGAFSTLLGQPEAGAKAIARAIAAIRSFGDAEDLFIALTLEAQAFLYLGRFDELTDLIDEAIALGEEPTSRWTEGPFWAAGFKNLRAFSALARGDVDLAISLLDESKSVLEPLNELYFMTWNYGHRGRVALGQGQPKEAIDLYTESVERARKVGFPRGLQVSTTGLGDASLASGDLAGAELAFVESLGAAERTNMVPEMLGTLVKLARVFAADKREREAVELLATVAAEPASERQLFTEGAPIKSMAFADLERLQRSIDSSLYEEAHAAGSARLYGMVVKGLIDNFTSTEVGLGRGDG